MWASRPVRGLPCCLRWRACCAVRGKLCTGCTTTRRHDKPRARYGHWRMRALGGWNARRVGGCGQAKGHLAAVQDGVMHVVEVVCISAGRSPTPSTPTGSSSHAPEARCAPWSNQLSPRPVHHPTTLHNTTRPPESAASWLISMPFEKCTITILTKTAHLFGQRGPPVTLHLDCRANHLHLDFSPIIGQSAASSTVPIGAPIVV